ncbi:MAG TPA: nucleotidyl transferase AbiEii/AbiGii toxin family protein [Clostridia bacterium]|jgi:predicted nucleotidyltransferase component of viral defense system|nr:nucleotidyl transferase AbiEii/AbiGii toxin family protein [Clostridiaceae bacterium]HOF26635.1 nucleotidyl transferase AbiEii/AbiGii toxin family protein [Clostridia bacterium]HOM34328.1 nucleotidyl transferase AbiEii/AbiGii toxin family protein [Clostridia bacterium]HOR89366.1 nucleotidyl transferase AbiEii/AbiGii toxin family protein [Clostridia bacterium]HOT71017.1 nucleotidyl transferase AbiEii/AbiGii toxin family protein [Clostridia bacterium]
MKTVAKLSADERRELFRNTADKMGLNDAIVEKDFWVCFMLDYLFHRSPWKEHLSFKGGTSLSKAYNLINRFSEDIDLILDWRLLGYGVDEPWIVRSNTKQDLFNKEANTRTEEFLNETVCPKMKSDLSQELNSATNIYIDKKDKQTILFAYPNLFENASTLKVIRLEIGPLAAWTPARKVVIESYAAKHYSSVFCQKTTEVLTVLPERTFWEKATILHHEANRPKNLPMPKRYSRHYYDLYRMADTPVKSTAFDSLELLTKVAEFKMKFYPRAWAKYQEAKRGTLKLIPPSYRIPALSEDYQNMRNMLYGEIPTFNTIMNRLSELEKEINVI